MRTSTLITLLKIEIDNIERLIKYYEHSTNETIVKHMKEIVNKTNETIILLGGTPHHAQFENL